MSALRQAGLGILTALFSSALVFGSMLLALAEGGKHVALAPTPTSTEIIATLRPGEPTFIPTPLEPTETPVEPTAICESSPPGWTRYEVLPGDTLPELAQRYGTSVEMLRQANCLDTDNPPIGSVISVPPPPPSSTPTYTATPPTPTTTEEVQPEKPAPRPQSRCDGHPASWVRYRVRKGETLSYIARAYGTTVARLKAENCLTSNNIRGGQILFVPNIAPKLPRRTPTPRSSPPRPVKTLPPPVDPGPLVPPPVEFKSPSAPAEIPDSTKAPVVPDPSLSL